MADPITIGGLGAAAVLFVAAHVRAVLAIGRISDHREMLRACSPPAEAPTGNPAKSPVGAS